VKTIALICLVVIGTSLQAQTHAAPKSASNKADAIRGMDFGKAMNEIALAQDADDCAETDQPTPHIAQTEFGDLDGDGIEEAVVTAYSCLAGTGGVDLMAVFKLSGGTLKRFPIDFDLEKPLPPFEGRDVSTGLRGHLGVKIRSGQLLLELPIYNPGDANCCPSGGLRQFILRWDGTKLALENVVDLPATDH
jgi:hypothetical protein